MLSLAEISPKKSSFKLKLFEKKFLLRSITLEDEIWLKQEYGDKANDVFNQNNPDFKEICRIAYRLLLDKKEFKVRPVKLIDEQGNETAENIGGLNLFYKCITCFEDKIAVTIALVETMGVSRKVFDEVRDMIDGDKKKVKKK